jgi:hypothetical protein
MFFFYQKNFAGKWIARKEDQEPTPKGAESIKRKPFTSSRKLTDEENQMTLSELEVLYPMFKAA